MAYGVHLGILLMCLVQAEHVCCSWAAQAQRQNGNAYVGFSHQDSGYGGGGYPQNELRQASGSPHSAQSGSFNADTAVSGGYSRGLSSGGYTQTVSQPDKSGSSVRFVQSSSASTPNWQKLNQVNAQKMPKKQRFALSTSIASGSSVSKYDKGAQRGTPSTSSSSASLQSPSRESYSFNSPQKPPAAAPTPAHYGQTSPSASSSLFGAGAPLPQRSPAKTRTSASAIARRVSSRRNSKPSSLSSLQNERTGNYPEAGKLYTSKLFPVNAGNAQGRPTSTSHMTSSRYGQSVPMSDKPGGFQPSRLQTSTSYTSMEQIPSSVGPLQTSWNNRNQAQGARDLPASGGSGERTSGQRYAPTRTHYIPQPYGGHPIRRLKGPDQEDASVGKPQQTYVVPKRPPTQQTYVVPKRPPTQQTYVVPKRPPTQQTYVVPKRPPTQQTYVVPKRPPTQQTYVVPKRPPTQQTYVVPKRPPTQQAYVAPYRPAAQRPQAQSVHPETKWKRIRLRPVKQQVQ